MPKHDPTMPATKLDLGGETYDLLFDFEAIAEAEDAAREPLLFGLQDSDALHPRITLIRAMLYGALRRNHPELKFQDACALVTLETAAPIWATVTEAYQAFMPPPAPKQEGAGTGDPRVAQD